MNHKSIVKLTNIIGIVSIILLVYWVFVFISITVFGLKVFRQNLTEIFYLSVIGVLALMAGALIINVMFNLTRIAEKHNLDELDFVNTKSKRLSFWFGISFPIIFFLLFGGDYLTSKKKEKMLIASAKTIVEGNPEKTEKLLNYQFNNKWIMDAEDILDVYSSTDSNFPNVKVIISDTIGTSISILGFDNFRRGGNDTVQPIKKDYIHKTTKDEREYLRNVFKEKSNKTRFSASDGNYELFYPYIKNEKVIVLYFSDYSRYGKFGR